MMPNKTSLSRCLSSIPCIDFHSELYIAVRSYRSISVNTKFPSLNGEDPGSFLSSQRKISLPEKLKLELQPVL